MRISDWSSDVCSSDLASAVSGQAIDEPRYRTGRIAQHARTEAGLFDCAVARHDRTDPPQVERAEIHDRIADDDARIGGLVRDRVEHGPPASGLGILAHDARDENIDRGHDMKG